MIFQLRKGNEIVCDVEITTPKEDWLQYIELHSSIFVAGYSRVLAHYIDEMLMVIRNFQEVEELRGWLWENYFGGKKNVYSDDDYNNVVEHVKSLLKKLAKEYDLYYVED